MRYKWLNKSNNKTLIVFFSGWGTDERAVSHLDCENNDVIAFYDYTTFEAIHFDFSAYEKKYLIAWSMGVYVCNYFYDIFKNFDKYIAINGTQKPIDNEFGIPSKIYDLTVNNFNELSCRKFMNKISSNIDLSGCCSRSIEQLKEELISIRDLKPSEYFNFDFAIVSENDKIIPFKNQINYWNTKKVPFSVVNSSHYIFDSYKSWSDLI